MLVLAIDTSTMAGSVALFHSAKGLIAEQFLNVRRNHSDTIMSAIDSMFKYSDQTLDEVGKIAVTVGPGSFTGIRVGVSIAKGFVFGKEREVVGVNTLDLIANNVPYTEGYIMPLIDARKGRAYYSLYQYKNGEIERVEEYKDGTIEEFLHEYKDKKITFAGDASYIYMDTIEEIMERNAVFLNRANIYPKAGVLAAMSLNMEGQNQFELEPYYHSKTQAEREKEAREAKKGE